MQKRVHHVHITIILKFTTDFGTFSHTFHHISPIFPNTRIFQTFLTFSASCPPHPLRDLPLEEKYLLFVREYKFRCLVLFFKLI